MKKTYRKPEMVITKVETEGRILEGSLGVYNETASDGGWAKGARGDDEFDDEW